MQSLVNAPDGREVPQATSQTVSESSPLSEAWRSWSNLLACGALTPGLLSMLILAVGGATLVWTPSVEAAPALLAANNANGPVIAFKRPTHADQLRGKEQISVAIDKKGRYPAKWIELMVDDYAATKGGPVQLTEEMLPIARFEWDTRVYADGPHKLSVIVTDSQGFKGRADVQVYINNKGENDIIPPTVRWLNVRNGDVIRGEFPVQVEATDNIGVKWVLVSLNPAISPTLKPALRGALLNIPPYIFRLNTKNLPASRYILNAEAFDARDNRGVATPVEVLIGPNLIGNPVNGLNFPSPKSIEIPTPSATNSGEEGANGTGKSAEPPVENTGPLTAESGNVPPVNLTPSLSGTRETGGQKIQDVLPGVTGNLPAERTVREPSIPGATFAAIPPQEKRSSPSATQITRAATSLSNPASPALPSETRLPSRAPRVAKGNPVLPGSQLRSLPRAGDVSAPARGMQALPPVTSPLAGTSRPTRATTGALQSTAPQAENRIAANATNSGKNNGPVAKLAAPQLSREANVSGVSIGSVARNESHAVKVPVSQSGLASLPSLARRTLPRATSAPQLTRTPTQTGHGIARQMPEVKARLPLGPTLAVLPAIVKPYPEFPSVNLTKGGPRSTQKIGNGSQALPPSVPKSLPTIPSPLMAKNPPMPKTGAARPLESITVAPVSKWGTQAEVLPVTHTVLRNESLYSIARRYKMPVAVLATANKLKPTSNLPLGAKLNLPRALNVTYGGRAVKTDAASFMMGTVGVTPFRFLFEKQGGKLKWDAKTRRVTAKGPQGNIELTIGSRTAVVNEKESLMDLAAFLMSGRTMVPLRFFEQALHAQIEWDPATGRLYVATSSAAPAPKG
ncbi:MAG TPA: stalk domain-containing protein [Abditibacteriaceae bacterium]|jgi:LysM repeat protein